MSEGASKSDPRDAQTICFCYSVTRGEIVKAIREEGADSVYRIQELTTAVMGCGACEVEVLEIIDEERDRKKRGP